MDWIISMVGALISAFIAITFVIWIEILRKPKLGLGILKTRTVIFDDNRKRPAKILRVCEVYLENHNLPRCFRFMSRNDAVHCYGYITFHDKNGVKVTNNQMPIKWAKLPRVELLQGGTQIEHPLYE